MPDFGSGLNTVIFDLGAVVLRWEPERAYEQVLPPDQVSAFMTEIDFWNWNRVHDAGQPFEVGEQALIDRLPQSVEAVRAYRQHFAHTLTGLVDGTGAIIAELERAGVRLIALTNWSAETFPRAQERFQLLKRFEGIVVSGTERLAKPDPAIFRLLCDRYRVEPTRGVFVDDSAANVEAAARLGLTAIQFSDATTLRSRLVDLGLLGGRDRLSEPIFHVTERSDWDAALLSGDFPWSSRNLSYQQQGFVHCSFRGQVDAVLDHLYSDVPRTDLVLLELDPALVDVPVVIEALDGGPAFPHLYAPLPVAAVTAVHALDQPS